MPVRSWTDVEVATLREHYPSNGLVYCLEKLPGRTHCSVFRMVSKLKLRRAGLPLLRRNFKARYAALDKSIAEAWPTLKGRGAVQDLADRLDVPRWVVSRRASLLGLALPHKKEPPWTPGEDALLEAVPLHDPRRCSRIFRERGYARTPTSIVVRSKRVGLSRRFNETLSATAAAKILGVDGKNFSLEIHAGRLTAGRRGTIRTPQQGGDAHAITRAELRRYIVDNLDRIDIRKVDKFAFVDVLVDRKDPIAEARRFLMRQGDIVFLARAEDATAPPDLVKVNGQAMTPAELLDRARRKGFDPLRAVA